MVVRKGLLVGVCALLGLSLVAGCVGVETTDVEVEEPWVRAAKEGQNTAAYMVINSGMQDRLVGATADVASTVQIHESIMEGDVARMRELPNGIPIEPGETVTLEPGGLHIMLMDLVKDLDEGDTVTLTLQFENRTNMTFEAPVRAGAAGAMDHGG
jgi:copper(I)-binding protein